MNAPFLVSQLFAQTQPVQNPGGPPAVRLARPSDGAATVIRIEPGMRLDFQGIANEQIVLVRAGDRLIVLFQDRSSIVLEQFFDGQGRPVDGVGMLVGDGQVIAGAQFATLFPISTDQSILPAAGPASASGSNGSAKNTPDPTFDDPLVRNPLDLLGNEAFAALAEDDAAGPARAGPSFGPGFRDGTLDILIDEDGGLIGGNEGGPADAAGVSSSASGVFTGNLEIAFGSSPPASINPLVLFVTGFDNGTQIGTASGRPVLIFGNGTNTLEGRVGEEVIFRFSVVVNPNGTSSYTFTIFDQMDHRIEGGGAFEDNLLYTLRVVATNADGLQGEGTLVLGINDDSPVIGPASPTEGSGSAAIGVVDEDVDYKYDFDAQLIDGESMFRPIYRGEFGGNPFGNGDAVFAGRSTSGNLNIRWGADDFDIPDGLVQGSGSVLSRVIFDDDSFGALQDGASFNSNAGSGALTARSVFFTDATVGFASPDGGTFGDGVLTSRGQTIQFRVINDGTTLQGYVAGTGFEDDGFDGDGYELVFDKRLSFDRIVFEVRLSDDGSGRYVFRLFDVLDHPVVTPPTPDTSETPPDTAETVQLALFEERPAFGGYEDDIILTFNFTARDFDSDRVNGTFSVMVDDDTPVVSQEGQALTLDEEGLGGNTGATLPGDVDGTAVSGSGWLGISWGADNASNMPDNAYTLGDRSVTFAPSVIDDLNELGLSSLGKDLVYSLNDAGTFLVATAGVEGEVVFTVALKDWASGEYTFTLSRPLDHPTAGREDTITLNFTFVATDSDGDATGGSFSVLVNDDSPALTGGSGSVSTITVTVDEDALATASAPGNNDAATGDADTGTLGPDLDEKAATGTLNIAWGADNRDAPDSGTGQDAVGRSLTFTNTTVGVFGAAGATLTSNGDVVTYSLNSSGTVLLGRAGSGDTARDVIRVSLSDDGTGSFRVELYDNLDHANGGNENDITLTFNFTATDSDGDSIGGQFAVVVDDDLPVVSLGAAAGITNGLFFTGFVSNGDVWGAGSGVATGSAGTWQILASPVNGASNLQLEKVGDGYRGADSPTNSVMVDLEASPGNIELAQSINGLTQGVSYKLTFEIGRASDASATSAELQVVWNGNVVGTYTPTAGVMQTITIDVVAGAGANAIAFREVGAAGDNTGTFLANVRLTDQLVVDETPGAQADSDEPANPAALAALFSGVSNPGTDTGIGAPQFASSPLGTFVTPSIKFGADGPAASNAVVYSLAITNAASGLKTTEGRDITLFLENGLVVGRYDAAGGEVGSNDPAAFAFRIDPVTGSVAVAQYVSLQHPNTSSADEGISLNAGTLSLIVTVTDFDNDPVSASADISGVIRFEDDAPTLVSSAFITRTVDEDDISTSWSRGTSPFDGTADGSDTESVSGPNDPAIVTGSLSGVVNAGADNPVRFTFTDNAVATLQGLQLTSKQTGQETTGQLLTYVQTNSGDWQIITASEPLTPGIPNSGNPVFELRINSTTGEYQFRLFDELVHKAPAPGGADQNFELRSGGTTIDALDFGGIIKATDGDGDSVVLTGAFRIQIRDDVPVADIDGNFVTIVHDETPGTQSADSDTTSASVIARFANVQNTGNDPDVPPAQGAIGYARSGFAMVTDDSAIGADSPAASRTFSLAIDGTDSGVRTTDGSTIRLVVENGIVVGRVNAGAFQDQAAFAVDINPSTGEVYVAQWLSLRHPNTSSTDEAVSLSSNLRAVLTVVDSDGDTATDSISIGSRVRFEDDAPDLLSGRAERLVDEDDIATALSAGTSPAPGSATETSTGAAILTGSVGGFVDFGADGNGGFAIAADRLSSELGVLGLRSKGTLLQYAADNTGNATFAILTATADGRTVFELKVDKVTGAYEFRLFDQLDHDRGDGQNTALQDAVPFFNVVDIDFGDVIRATDGDGDSIRLDGKLLIRVRDDVPEAFSVSASTVLDDEAQTLFPANTGGTNDVAPDAKSVDGAAGSLFKPGSDDRVTISLTPPAFSIITKDNAGAPVQAPVTWSANPTVDANGAHTWTATVQNFGTAATLVVRQDGSYTFTLMAPVVHPTPGASEEDLALRFNFTVRDFDGDAASGSLSITVDDDTPVIPSVNALVRTDDDALGGNPSGIGDDPNAVAVTGTLSHAFGADGGTIAFVQAGAPQGFTYAAEGTTLSVFQGQTKVLTVTVNPITGAYTVTQNANILHAPGSDENNQVFDITYRVTDGDNDTVDGVLSISVDDDTPRILFPQPELVDEDGGLPGGNPGPSLLTGDFDAGSVETGILNVDWGADDENPTSGGANGDRSLSFAGISNGDVVMATSLFSSQMLTAGGQTVTAWIVGNTLYGFVGTHSDAANPPPVGQQVFRVTLNDAGSGSYTFELLKAVDHPYPSLVPENNLVLDIGFRATDADGDSVTSKFLVTINDDTPVIPSANPLVRLDDDVLTNGNAGGNQDDADPAVPFTGVLQASFGADGPGAVSWLTSGATLPSGFTLAVSGSTLTISQNQGGNSVAVLEAVITNTATGAYSIKQLKPILHPQGTTPGTEDNVSFTVSYRVQDFDGDRVTGTLSINVDDDTPVVSSNTLVQLDDDALAGGNPNGPNDDANGALTGTLAFNFGADGAGRVEWSSVGLDMKGFGYAISGTNNSIFTVTQDQNGTPVAVLRLTITNNVTGAYSIEQLAPVQHTGSIPGDEDNRDFTIAYRVFDRDGDAAATEGKLTINIDDDTPVVASNAMVQLDDDALSGGNPDGPNDDANGALAGTLGFNFGADGAGRVEWSSVGLDMKGFGFQISGTNNSIFTVTQDQNGTPVAVLRLTITNSVTGAYTIEQLAPVQHTGSIPGDEDNRDFTIAYRVFDKDGDSAPTEGQLTINIDDDTPTASTNATLLLDDDALSGGNPGGPGDDIEAAAPITGTLSRAFGADGAGYVAWTNVGLITNGFGFAISGSNDTVLTISQEQSGAWVDVLRLTITDRVAGTYQVEQLAAVRHDEAGTEDNRGLTVAYRVFDKDGDSAAGQLTIDFDDDTPVLGAGPANLVQNPSFETTVPVVAQGNWALFNAIPGWTKDGNTPFEIQAGNIGDLSAQDGFNKVELDSDTDGGFSDTNATIQQTITTETGGTYLLTFFYSPRPSDGGGNNSGMDVLWNGQTVLSINSTGLQPGWNQYSVAVTAGSNLSTLAFKATGPANELGAYLDNVSVVPVTAVDEDGLNRPGFAVGNNDSQPGDAVVLNTDGDGTEATATGGLAISWGADNADAADTGGVQDSSGRSLTFTNTNVSVVGVSQLTSNGEAVTFSLESNGTVMVGKAGTRDVMRVALSDDGTGSFRVTLLDNLDHAPGQQENDIILRFNYTAKDSDGDPVNGSFVVAVDDDLPVMSLGAAAGVTNGLFFDGFVSNNNAWGQGSGVATGSAAGWQIQPSPVSGASNLQLEKVGDGYRGADSPTNSVMVDLEASPGNVQLVQSINGLTDGVSYKLSFEIGRASDANAGTAQVVVLWNNIVYGPYTPTPGVMQTITLDVVAGPSNTLTFREIGTSGDNTGTYLANVRLSDQLVIDETPGAQADSDEPSNSAALAALFNGVTGKGTDAAMGGPQYASSPLGSFVTPNIQFGADGPGATSIVYTLAVTNAVSGLKTTEGRGIVLFNESGIIVGRFDPAGGSVDANDPAALAFHVNPATGTVSVAQFVSLQHPNPLLPNEGVGLNTGTLAVTVTATDGDGDPVSASADISGAIVFRDDAPAVANAVAAGTEDGPPVVLNLLSSVTGNSDGTASVSLVGTPVFVPGPSAPAGSPGMVSLVNGVLTFTPASNWNGTATFTYQVIDGDGDAAQATATITIAPVNDAPVAVSDAYATNEDMPLTIPAAGILENDLDVDNNALSSILVTGPMHGTLTLNVNGSFTYTPNGNYNGPDSFTYRVNDGSLDSNVATVNITVNPMNDVPVAVNDANNLDPVVEAGVTPGNTTFAGDPTAQGNVLTNDTDIDVGDTKIVVAVGGVVGNVGQQVNGTYGRITIAADGTYNYELLNTNAATNALAKGAPATDVFSYTMADGSGATSTATVTINITGTNDAPVMAATVTSGSVTELANNAPNENIFVHSATGAIAFTDVDLTDSHSLSVTPVSATDSIAGPVSFRGTFSPVITNMAGDDGAGVITWTFEVSDGALDNLAAGQTLTQVYNVTVTDANGATASRQVTITINGAADNAPLVVSGSIAGIVEEEHITPFGLDDTSGTGDTDLSGNLTNRTNVVTGTPSLSFTGLEGAASYSLVATTGSAVKLVGGANLTSDGEQVVAAVDGNTLYGYVEKGGTGYNSGTDKLIFTLALNSTTTGAYTFTLNDSIDHHATGDNVEGTVQIDLGGFLRVTDQGDTGDTAPVSDFKITVIDDVPMAGAVSDGVLANQVGGFNGTVGFRSGADTPALWQLTPLTNVTGVTYATQTQADGGTLLTASAGGNEYFRLDLNADGTYRFDLVTPRPVVSSGSNILGSFPEGIYDTITVGGAVFDGLEFDDDTTNPRDFSNTQDNDERLNVSGGGFGIGNANLNDDEGFMFARPNTDSLSFDVAFPNNDDTIRVSWAAYRGTSTPTSSSTPVETGFIELTDIVSPSNANDVERVTINPNNSFDYLVVRFDNGDNKSFLVRNFAYSSFVTPEDQSFKFNVTVVDKDGDAVTSTSALEQIDIRLVGGGPGSPINVLGTEADEVFVGSTGNDTMSGSAGNDALQGGSGNDLLIGGTGNDRLTGGSNADTFRFNGTGDAMDTIVDFSSADGDKIGVDVQGFGTLVNSDFNGGDVGQALRGSRFATTTNLTTATDGAFSADQHFIFYDGAGGADPSRLYYDPTPTGAGSDRLLLAQLENGATLTAADIIRST